MIGNWCVLDEVFLVGRNGVGGASVKNDLKNVVMSLQSSGEEVRDELWIKRAIVSGEVAVKCLGNEGG